MPLETPRSTLRTLFDAQPGDSFWFAFAYGGPQGEWFLTLSPQADDPKGEGVVRDLKRMYALGEDPGRVTSGVARVEPAGFITFSGQAAAPDLIAYLERYVRRQLRNHPALRRLVGARYQQLTPKGRLVNEFKNNAMWEDLLGGVPLVLETQLSATAAVLRGARGGDRLLFWLTPSAVSGGPLLVLRRSDGGDDFGNVVARVQGEVGFSPRSASGFVDVDAKGNFTFSTDSKRSVLGKVAELVRAHLGTHPALGRLIGAQQIRIQPDGTTGEPQADAALWEGLEKPQIEASSTVLRALRRRLKGVEPGQKFYFDFVAQGPSGEPMLVLTPNAEGRPAHAEARKSLTAGSRPLSRPLGGLAQAAKAGRTGLHFRAKSDDDGFLPALAAFVQANVKREPSLSALSGSIFSVLDEDGNTVKRHQDASLWAD